VRHCFGADVADAAVGTVSPSPAPADVQHPHLVARRQFRQQPILPGWFGKERRACHQVADQRLGVVGGDYPAGQRRIGQILAIGMG